MSIKNRIARLEKQAQARHLGPLKTVFVMPGNLVIDEDGQAVSPEEYERRHPDVEVMFIRFVKPAEYKEYVE